MTAFHHQATEYIDAMPSPQKEICQTLRELILDGFPQMTEQFKWKYPAYYYKGKRVCVIGGFKAHANIELFYGARLEDSQGQIEGAGKRTRHIKLKALKDIDTPYLIDLIRHSIELLEGDLQT
jgi:hypothetical protein